MVRTAIFCFIFVIAQIGSASQLLVPMDESQKNHLKSYGLAYWLLNQKQEVQWLLNYQGGSFLFAYSAAAEKECKVRGIS
ncbi:MAG: asparagine synthetase B, partial [Bacteroidota bacterium]